MITSRDKENSFDKIQQPFMLKIQRKRACERDEGMFRESHCHGKG